MHSVFYSVLPIFLIAFLGSVIRRKWLTSDEFWRGLEKLSFYLLFPAVLFEHISQLDFSSSAFFKLGIALVFSTLIVSAALVVYQMKKDFDRVQFTSLFQGATRYNNYIFFALSSALFGDEGLRIVATISPYMIILTNVTSIIVFAYYVPQEKEVRTRRKSLLLLIKSIFTNPFIIASIIGFIFNYFKLELNVGVEKTIHSLADSALSIGILIVGAGLKFSINHKHFHLVALSSLIKLIIMPVITFSVLSLLAITGTAKSIGVLFSCLPCASSSYILSRQLGGDPETMSSIITFSTIFSILSLSLLVYIFG